MLLKRGDKAGEAAIASSFCDCRSVSSSSTPSFGEIAHENPVNDFARGIDAEPPRTVQPTGKIHCSGFDTGKREGWRAKLTSRPQVATCC